MFGADAWGAVLLFCLFSVEHVVYAEGDDSVIWRYIMNNAVVRPFHIEVVGIHESHAPNQQ